MNELKQEYFPVLVRWAEKKGFEKIKANTDGFTTPIAYERQDDNDKFIPDATGFYMFEKSYFEIVFKTQETERLATKLQLMSLLAQKNNGNLYVMAPKGHYLFARRLIKDNHIYAEVIKIEE